MSLCEFNLLLFCINFDTGHKHVATLLVELGDNVNAEDKNGLRPLHWAVKDGNYVSYKLEIRTHFNFNSFQLRSSGYRQVSN